jgi:uridine kinase
MYTSRILTLIFTLLVTTLVAQPKILIGIAGGTGSGKTTLAQKIQDAFPNSSILISQDSYYKDLSHLSPSERAKTNFDHPNSLDFTLLCEHLTTLTNDAAVDQPIYNFCTNSREKETKRIQPAQLIIVEGILLFTVKEVRDLFSIKIYVDTDDDIRVLRRIERDMKEPSRDFESVKSQYLTTVKPMHDAFVGPSKQYADVIVPEGGYNQIATDLIISKLKGDVTS